MTSPVNVGPGATPALTVMTVPLPPSKIVVLIRGSAGSKLPATMETDLSMIRFSL